ncbi:hypothetical protein Pmani_014875 [Petrolisthes manimaculis]|uniref:Uncharacterized protein n=1 Tax=Petrolisthes manimaculis TaxID=1843537 RepID=A0AAE1PSR7_9EUCA|nr:hypothetical protein Pmani_014875 [Petrolisthes manimaculis]
MKITYPLSFTSFKWKKQPKHLKKKGGECWVELSTNNDDDEEELILDLKCPYDLPEFPQLQLTVKCPPDDVEQCATINYCNTKSEATTVNNPTHCDDYIGRVVTPWNITPAHNTISIILKITEWRMQVYNDTPSTTSPPRYYLVQIGIDWMRVTDTTPGHNQTVQQYNCSRPLPHFPNLTITLTCWNKKECGTVNQPCPTDLDHDNNSTEAMEMCLVVWGPIMLSVPNGSGGGGGGGGGGCGGGGGGGGGCGGGGGSGGGGGCGGGGGSGGGGGGSGGSGSGGGGGCGGGSGSGGCSSNGGGSGSGSGGSGSGSGGGGSGSGGGSGGGGSGGSGSGGGGGGGGSGSGGCSSNGGGSGSGGGCSSGSDSLNGTNKESVV